MENRCGRRGNVVARRPAKERSHCDSVRECGAGEGVESIAVHDQCVDVCVCVSVCVCVFCSVLLRGLPVCVVSGAVLIYQLV